MSADLIINSLLLPLAQIADGGGGNYQGAVGNIISAGLQTKGIIDQASILQSFRDELEWIAAAGWFVSIVMGIGAFAVFGNYRQAAYLLVGPPLFYYMIYTTVPTNGVETKFGDRYTASAIDEQKKLHRWIKTIDGGEKIEISFFFALFDSIISEFVQKTVSVVLDTDNKNDLRYVAREFALSHLLQGVAEDHALGRLIYVHHLGDCGEDMEIFSREMGRRKKVNKELRDDTDIDRGTKKVEEHTWKNKSVALESSVKAFLMTVKDSGASFDCASSPPGTCDNDMQLSSCEEIWKFTRASLIAHAEEILTPDALQGAQDSDTEYPLSKAIEEVKEWFEKGAQGGTADAAKVLAVYIYKNSVTKGTAEALQGQIFNRSPINSNQFEAVFGKLESAEAAGGYFKLQYFSRSIPYIQGLLLYLLSIAFPFFAVFLVLPGKAPSFLAWCSLWAWVKSWDIGFALVYITRDIFWYMMQGSVNLFDAEEVWQATPASVLKVAYQNDPLMGQNTYWIIVSILTCMVPVVTAHLAMGATNMFDMFKNSIDQTAIRFGQAEGNAKRRHEANKLELFMDELQHSSKRVGMVGTAGLAAPRYDSAGNLIGGGLTTANGNPVHLANARNGMYRNAFVQNASGSNALFSVGDATGRELAAGGQWMGFLVQMSDADVRAGKYDAQIARLEAMETMGEQHNALRKEAAGLQDDDPKKAELTERADNLFMRITHGEAFDLMQKAEASRAQAVAAAAAGDNGLATKLNTQAAEYEANFKKLKAETFTKLGEHEKTKNFREEYMPVQYGHMARGMISMKDQMDEQSMRTWAYERRRMAAILERWNDPAKARVFRREAEEIEAKIKAGETIGWGEFVKREQKHSHDFQLPLNVVSRRRQYRLKNAHKAAAFSSFISNRFETAYHARSVLDSMSSFKNIPVGVHSYQLNPIGKGFKYEIFGGDFVSGAFSAPQDVGSPDDD